LTAAVFAQKQRRNPAQWGDQIVVDDCPLEAGSKMYCRMGSQTDVRPASPYLIGLFIEPRAAIRKSILQPHQVCNGHHRFYPSIIAGFEQLPIAMIGGEVQ
jgi:hypothetical protein